MAEGPKLYTNKPKKAQLKQFQEHRGNDFSSPSSSMGTPASSFSSSQPPPPPPPPKESFARRYKFLWPMLLTVNLAIGAYFFMRTKKKDLGAEEEVASTTAAATTAPTAEKPLPAPTIKEPAKLREPIPEDQQRELFKWILEEKRKVKPKDPEEKKRIDEEKAILKQFIRAKSFPSF
ncbi:hypothetical protein UlMin_011948 [Ulmus minor]